MNSFITLEHATNTVSLAALGVVALVVCTEIVSRIYRRRTRSAYDAARSLTTDAHKLEQHSLTYFKHIQALGIVRVCVYITLVCAGVVIYNIQTFNYLVIVLGALVVVLKDMVASMAGYAAVLGTYAIGDDVRVGDKLGEIVRIRLLSTSLVGKEDNGEYNGKLFTVPNYLFLQNVVEQQELRFGTLRHVTVRAVYSSAVCADPFDTWLHNLKIFLNELLPTRVGEDVGNFRGFMGAKYKTNYAYNDEGELVVSISFVSNMKSVATKKEKIVTYIESTKKP